MIITGDGHTIDVAPLRSLAVISSQVNAQASLYGAGHSDLPAACSSPGVPPVLITLPKGADRIVQLTSVIGTMCYSEGCNPVNADGRTETFPPQPGAGLADMTSIGTVALCAVLLDDTEPQDPPPASLDVGDGSFAELSPGLRQIFWVGDGLTGEGSGSVQRFHVPSAATRLFFGIVDGDGSGHPGCYGDNTGGFALQGQILGR